ncbi:MAG TPA: prepilin-type N-terminal cleavage/methylation domain-containing protein [Thermoanaerobaculia bacterium]|nr:prepilin-type N-terminal cleavage/methylation domain-containing protein [Thermoanaerobaculia bacterium]
MTDPRPRRAAGFSILEVLIAVVVLSLIAMMILPLLSRSAEMNLFGRESTEVVNRALGSHEQMAMLPFGHALLEVTSGTENRVEEVWVPAAQTEVAGERRVHGAGGEWKLESELATGERPLWRRAMTVRQHQLTDLTNDPIDDQQLDEPLPGGTDPIFVHLKVVDVEIEGERSGGPMGTNRRVLVRRIKAF